MGQKGSIHYSLVENGSHMHRSGVMYSFLYLFNYLFIMYLFELRGLCNVARFGDLSLHQTCLKAVKREEQLLRVSTEDQCKAQTFILHNKWKSYE